MGSKEQIDGVCIFVAQKWVDSVVGVERQTEWVILVKLVLGDRLVNVFRYILHIYFWKARRWKESFWNDVFMKVGCVPQAEMVVLAGDTKFVNGHWSLVK